eukprot:jgi/Phyca11/551168/estExt2_Genewise1Plus.C_PHYCAscaffold_400320
MLQRNERLGEQPPQSNQPVPVGHLENKDINNNENTTTHTEEIMESPPQISEAGDETNVDKGDTAKLHPCPKCGKEFTTGTSLRTHLANVYPCDQPHSVLLPIDGKLESKTCFKCGKTFASWQGLRGHLQRIKPCDQEKPAATTPRRRPAASRTCTKCGKTFSSPQSLRIHMNRVKPCDQNLGVETTIPTNSTPPSTPIAMSAEDVKKEAERKARARYQARKAYLKKRGRLDELGDPPIANNRLSGKDEKGVEETMPNLALKRSAEEELSRKGDSAEPLATDVKKPRVDEAQTQVAEPPRPQANVWLTPIPSIPTPSSLHDEPEKKKEGSEGNYVQHSIKDHGGDLLAGGCSCPPCVRKWARKLMNRMQQLEDEVVMLRQMRDADADKAASRVRHDEFTQNNDQQQQSPSEMVLSGLGFNKQSLMDAYSHRNDQVLVNERTIEESSGHAQILAGFSPSFHRQFDELRASIVVEKSNRDIAAATLIAHEWKPRQDKIREILESTAPQSYPEQVQACHTKWAEITKEISMKEQVMDALEKRMDSLGQSGASSRSTYAEMGELSSKMAAESAAKMALERELEAIYEGLVKSSPYIRSLVRNALSACA